MSGPRTAIVLTTTWADADTPTDPGEAAAVLTAYRDQLFLPIVEAHGGRLGDSSPDRLAATFDRADAALTCATEIRHRTGARYARAAGSGRPPFRWSVTLAGDASSAPSGEPGEVAVSPLLAAAIDPALLSRSFGRGQDFERPAADATVFGSAPDTAAGWTGTPHGAGLRPGSLLNGTYEIEEKLASGGMGEVFKGREIHSGGAVAIKVIRLDMAEHPSALSLFQKEALVLRDIYHDAIVRYYSFSFDPGLGRYYLVMEFVDGPPLSRVLEGGPMPVETVALLCRRVASGLQVAHERGIVHRDLSPDNVILPGGDVESAKIIDFGIARAASIGGGTIINGGFAGKNSYVSPEHLGLAGGEVTAKSDIYSLGIVLAEACLGRPLDMAGTQVEVIDKRRRVPDISGVDPRLRGLVARMLDPDPGRRPDTMRAVATAADLPPPEPPPLRSRSLTDAAPRRAAPPKPARPIERWIIGGALILALVGGAGVFAYTSLSAAAPPRPPAPTTPTLVASLQGNAPEATGEAAPSAPPALLADARPSTPLASPTDARAPAPPSLPAEAAPAVKPSQPAAASPEQHVAALTTLASPLASAPPQPVSMADYVAAYEGGDCFFLRPVRLTSTPPALDVFAASRDAFDKLDQSFQGRFGISPDIAGNRVRPRQCPAVEFLKRTAAAQAAPPALFIRSVRIRRGQGLAGEIRGLSGRSVALLLVGENGAVRNVTGMLKPDGDALTFDLMPAEASGPQILVAVASPKPLPSLVDGGPSDAGAVFDALLGTAARQNAPLSSDAKLFIVGG